MMMIFKAIFSIIILVGVGGGASVSDVYEGFKVYDISPKSNEDLDILVLLHDKESETRSLDFLSFHNNFHDVVQVAVQPNQQDFIEKFLTKNKLDYKVRTSNLQKNINDEQEELKKSWLPKAGALTFNRYYRHKDINKFLDNLQKENIPNVKMDVKNVGKSIEGRDIKIAHISNGDGQPKNSIFIDAGIHAREWIAPATALYFLTELINTQSNYSKLLNKFDFIIQPLVNPDGYEYSMNFYRLWRKNRRRNGICNGIDLNRNYDYSWNTGGSSSNSCAETYHGPTGFSENESQHSRDVIMSVKENCKFFLTLHSYGNYLLYPWGHKNEKPENWMDQDAVVKAGADAMRAATGVNYTTGSTAETLYAASGSSIDFAYGVAKIPISVVMELPGGGFFGFDYPASKLESAVKESAVGIAAMSEEIAKIFT